MLRADAEGVFRPRATGDQRTANSRMLKNLFSKGSTGDETQAEPGPARSEAGESRSYTVGWLLNTENASIIWDTPRPVRMESQSSDPRSVGQCPSVLDFDRRHFVINCPIDVHLRVKVTGAGRPCGMNLCVNGCPPAVPGEPRDSARRGRLALCVLRYCSGRCGREGGVSRLPACLELDEP